MPKNDWNVAKPALSSGHKLTLKVLGGLFFFCWFLITVIQGMNAVKVDMMGHCIPPFPLYFKVLLDARRSTQPPELQMDEILVSTLTTITELQTQ